MKLEKGRGKRTLLFLALLLSATAIVGYIVTQPPKPLGVGGIAPDFELKAVGPNGLTGEMVKLSSFRGRVVFLEFMESWCEYCRAVAPAVESIREDYEAKGVVFISVAGTHQGADAQSTAAFIRDSGTQWTYVLDSDNKIFSKYNVEATPSIFILDRNGVIVSTFSGIKSSQVMTAALDNALEV
jgi:thiol-disulfide isomerase/thioredoxin